MLIATPDNDSPYSVEKGPLALDANNPLGSMVFYHGLFDSMHGNSRDHACEVKAYIATAVEENKKPDKKHSSQRRGR
jgi:hypothetical protein